MNTIRVNVSNSDVDLNGMDTLGLKIWVINIKRKQIAFKFNYYVHM